MKQETFQPFDDDCSVMRKNSRQKAVKLAEIIENFTREEGRPPCPAAANGKKIAQSFWGYSWIRNIETYQDYENRLPKGRSLLRGGNVIDLSVTSGEVNAVVWDKEIYHVRIRIKTIRDEKLESLKNVCAGKIETLLDLVQGNLSEDILHYLADPQNGIFPEYDEIRFICGCLDDSVLCGHAAAALYGIGSMLDAKPDLFFVLRGIDCSAFFRNINAAAAAEDGSGCAGEAEPDMDALADVFGIDIDNSVPDAETDSILHD